MNDHPQHGLDDELLSAYLDDELSAEERAQIERRLADDPAARATLEQLRHVSQAVRDLPHQPVGRDLREQISQRAVAAKAAADPAASTSAYTESIAPIPKITIGRTTRGWVWASLAVAAALMIMVLQPDGGRNLPTAGVAQRRSESAERESLKREVPELRAAGEPMAESASGLAAVDGPAPASSNLAASSPASVPAPSRNGEAGAESVMPQITEPPAQTDQSSVATDAPADVSLGVASQSNEIRGELLDSVAAAPAQNYVAAVQENELVVVHVLAKRKALEDKSFEKLLADNGIAVEPELPAEQQAAELSGAGFKAASGREEQSANRSFNFQAGCEVVLVEAPSSAIESCMADLNQDTINYLSVEVDDSVVLADETEAIAPPVKKLAVDLGKYSRGVVPPQQKEVIERDKAAYYHSDAFAQDAPGEARFSGGRGGVAALPQEAGYSVTRLSELDRGRARRVRTWGIEETEDLNGSKRLGAAAGAGQKADALSLEDRKVVRQLKSAAGDTVNQQVIFFLCPVDETAPSPAAANRTE